METYILQWGREFARLVVWLLLLAMIFGPLERIFGLHPKGLLRKSFWVDLLYYFLNNTIPKILLVLPMALAAWLARHLVPASLLQFSAGLPLLARFPLALFVGETGFYWGHRWSHEIPWLWRFHAIHHSAEEMDWLVNTRAHPVDMVFTRLCGYVPLYVVGLANPSGAALDTVSMLLVLVSTIWGFFIHSNVKWRFGVFEKLLSTPAFHHWHHTYDKPLDKNYASMLPVLDLIFGSYYNPRKAWPARYGTETAVSESLGDQLIDPFVARR